MPADRPEIYKRDIIPSLWKSYQRSDEYIKQRRTESISSVHTLVRAAEEMGLMHLINNFIGVLGHQPDIRSLYEERTMGDWVDEWCSMNDILFKHLYRNRGHLRRLGQDVRFGAPGDEDLHRIPPGGPSVQQEIYEFAQSLGPRLQLVDTRSIDDVCRFLATIHYEFIRIHPFMDGNGRIARAVTDQFAIALGYPPIVAGFPRSNAEKKEKYHAAIRGCVGDKYCQKLSTWIKLRIEERIASIA